jgi:hypothetical protein
MLNLMHAKITLQSRKFLFPNCLIQMMMLEGSRNKRKGGFRATSEYGMWIFSDSQLAFRATDLAFF